MNTNKVVVRRLNTTSVCRESKTFLGLKRLMSQIRERRGMNRILSEVRSMVKVERTSCVGCERADFGKI
jgi:hypothetical protein